MLLFPCVIRNTIECAFHEYSIVLRMTHRGCFLLWRLRTLCFDLDCATIEKKEAAESAGRKTMGKKLRLLFIGNSHTYYNDMPLMAAKKARAAGYDCEVTMIAHGGWFLAQHV